MKVTGWTEWGDERYIDIVQENVDRRSKVMMAFPFPDIETLRNMSEKDREKYLKDRKSAVDKAFEEYYRDNDETEFLEEEIRNVVISAVRENGYHFFGEHHQNHPRGTPVIDDKYIYCVSMRRWGDIMAEAYPDEDYGSYDAKGCQTRYCKWAWFNPSLQDEIVLPE